MSASWGYKTTLSNISRSFKLFSLSRRGSVVKRWSLIGSPAFISSLIGATGGTFHDKSREWLTWTHSNAKFNDFVKQAQETMQSFIIIIFFN